MSKTVKGILIGAAAVIAVAAIIAGVVCSYIFSPPKQAQVETLDVKADENGVVKVGVISDNQLPNEAPEGGNTFLENTRKALQLFKEQGVDMIVNAGDICEVAGEYAYQSYVRVFNEVFPDEATRPATQYIMGNHDFWTESSHGYPAYKQKLFQKNMGTSPWTHYVVNGIHFIGASPDTGSSADAYSWRTQNWIKEQIEIAEKDGADTGTPIFVITHHNPMSTVYGSDSWGDRNLPGVLQDHPRVVSISGHSHYSILDERSIYQERFTAFTTQSAAYIEMENGKYNAFKAYDKETNKYVSEKGYASVPPQDEACPMVLIMNLGEKQTTVERWNVLQNKEEKADMRWTLNYPLALDHYNYRANTQRIGREAPVFAQGAAVSYDPAITNTNPNSPVKTLPGLAFPAAQHSDFVHSYYVRLTDGSGKVYEYTSFSDFYLGLGQMSGTVKIPLDPTLASGAYHAEIYAVESFGAMSRQPLTFDFQHQAPALPQAEA